LPLHRGNGSEKETPPLPAGFNDVFSLKKSPRLMAPHVAVSANEAGDGSETPEPEHPRDAASGVLSDAKQKKLPESVPHVVCVLLALHSCKPEATDDVP
jgi:hypothetical protein